MKKSNSFGKQLRRGLSLLFAFLMSFSILVLPPAKVSAASSKVQIYHWKLASTRADIRSGPVILTWTVDNVTYFTGKELTGLNAGDYPQFDFTATEFYTTADVPCWRMRYGVKPYDSDYYNNDKDIWDGNFNDPDNDGAPYVWLFDGYNRCMFYDEDGFSTLAASNIIPIVRDSDYETRFTVGTHGNKKYDKDTKTNCLRFIFNTSGSDPQLIYSGNVLKTEKSKTYTKASNFRVYIADVEEFSAITEDYTVESGSVFQIKGEIILTKGHTLTVRPGGTLSVEGVFYNDGKIDNSGNIIIQSNGFVTSMSPEGEGSVFCSGSGPDGEGNIVVMDGGILSIDESAVLHLKNADMLCMGNVVLPNGILMQDSNFVRRGKGLVFFGFCFKNGNTSAKDLLYRSNPASLPYNNMNAVPGAEISVYGNCGLIGYDENTRWFFTSFEVPSGKTGNGTLRRSYDGE